MTTKYKDIEKLAIECGAEKDTQFGDDAVEMSKTTYYTFTEQQLQAFAKAMLEASPAQESEPVGEVHLQENGLLNCLLWGKAIDDGLVKDGDFIYTHPPAQESEPVAMKCEAVAQDGRTAPMLWFKTYSQIPEGTKLYTHPPADKDAERYRWLRDELTGFHKISTLFESVADGGIITLKAGNYLDEAIDEAMKG